MTASGEEILEVLCVLARGRRVLAAPEGAATYAGYKKLIASGFLKPAERVVLFNTGSGLKTAELIKAHPPVLDPVDPELSKKIG